jgi:hypothetical protein
MFFTRGGLAAREYFSCKGPPEEGWLVVSPPKRSFSCNGTVAA